MKVGILTLPLWHNYGGILQAYALRQAVADLGHEAVLLDVRRPAVGRIALGASRLKRSLRRIARDGRRAPWYPDQLELAEISRNTRAFVLEKIQPRTSHIEIDRVMEDMSGIFDAIIVGSDQVWRREYMPDLQTYFLALPGDTPRRISYAASLGVDDWRFDPAESELFAGSLKKFSAVSVREDSAVELLGRELGVNSSRVCDPTLLFDADHYRRLAETPQSYVKCAGRIFTYVLDSDSDGTTALATLVDSLGGTAFNVMPKPFGPSFRHDRDKHVFPPVEAWLRGFSDCQFVITDSFHGCVFSLIYNRPFIAVVNVERGKARFESLLSRYGLTDRLFSSLDEVDAKALASIDWKRVNSIRAEEKQSALEFLRTALMPDPES
ncbi:polysaccharide pyruvyl transferase family protein [Lysobacter sp. A03]|uniref:polysaccharide pyruvyl transferase family protein n=1 Tax=Lysobacter sp. A03 TaxID=1199154 RepID=UPI0005C68F0D|nr:polysaccharide pyruvyl transferase family protein [Lysobacter sp. A03]